MQTKTSMSRSRLAGFLTIAAVIAMVVGMTIALTQPSPALAHPHPVYHNCVHSISDVGPDQLGLLDGVLRHDC